MNTEKEIEYIKERLDNLQNTVIQMQKNFVPVAAHADYVPACLTRIDDVEASINDTVYPAWDGSGYEYFQGERVSYNDKFYRCIQAHKSQEDWSPDKAVSLWSEVSDPSEEWPMWRQPTGAHDAYSKGDKVSHLEKHWISSIDANVYEPGVYGWDEV